ncbi:MAG: hypothetical protein J7J92_03510 [Candidatus Aenigmarchaeota archaeon]|nr:hypothetical protein [Candidatus Aenigmarchaeota archaeon]
MKRKGQKSLEMIIGLLILLVVAGVVINIFLNQMKPENLPQPEKELNIRNFKANCKSLCNKVESTEYCRAYFEKGDWDGDGVKNELVKVGETVTWDACEDRVYCFLVVPCEDRFGPNSIEGCKDMLCQAYIEKYRGLPNYLDEATAAVKDDIKEGRCNLDAHVEDKDNWYKRYFEDAGWCGTGGGGTTPTTQESPTTTQGSSPSVSCAVSDTNVTCTWNNCKNPGTLTLGTTSLTYIPNTESGSYTFSNVPPGTYNGLLVCEQGSPAISVTVS